MATPDLYEPRLKWFVEKMRGKLALPKNQAKGDWRIEDVERLYDKLDDELDELADAIFIIRSNSRERTEEIIKEAADVANLAMMVADKARAVQEKQDHDNTAIRADYPAVYSE